MLNPSLKQTQPGCARLIRRAGHIGQTDKRTNGQTDRTTREQTVLEIEGDRAGMRWTDPAGRTYRTYRTTGQDDPAANRA